MTSISSPVAVNNPQSLAANSGRAVMVKPKNAAATNKWNRPNNCIMACSPRLGRPPSRPVTVITPIYGCLTTHLFLETIAHKFSQTGKRRDETYAIRAPAEANGNQPDHAGSDSPRHHFDLRSDRRQHDTHGIQPVYLRI